MLEVLIGLFALQLPIGILCGLIAEQNGRQWPSALIAGTIFGIFSLVYYCAVGESRERKIENIAAAHAINNIKIEGKK